MNGRYEESTGQRDQSLFRRFYRGKVTIGTGVLFLIGLGCISGADNLVAVLQQVAILQKGMGELAHDIIRDIGLAALTSAFLSFAYEYILRDSYVDDVKYKLNEIYREHHKLFDQCHEAGLVAIHNSLTSELLKRKFEEAAKTEKSANVPKRIRIIQTYTGMPENDMGLKRLLQKAKRNKSDVQIMVLDPLSAQVEYRAQALHIGKKEFRDRIKQDLNNLKQLYPRQVKVYDATPMFHIYRFDNTSLIGAYWRGDGKLSIHGPQFEIDHEKAKDENLAQLIDKHFDSLWKGLPSDRVKNLSTALAELEKQEAREREEADSDGMAAEVSLTIHSQLDYKFLERRFRSLTEKARNGQQAPKIKILQTALAYRDQGLIGLIGDAAKAGCQVRILLLAPSSQQVVARAEALNDERYTPQRIRDNIVNDLKVLRNYRMLLPDISSEVEEHNGPNLEVKVYDAAPTIQLYQFGDSRIIGVPWRKCASQNAPQLEINDFNSGNRLSALAKRIDAQFEDLWDSKRTIDATEELERVNNELERVNKSRIGNFLLRNGIGR